MRLTRHAGRLLSLVALCALLTTGAATASRSSELLQAATPGLSASRWWDSAVCYEVFVRSFFDSDGDGIGDLNGLTAKLDYVNDGDPSGGEDLGATCIWLMPIFEAASYHGYDVVDYFAVERDYGTNDDFKRLVAEAHRRGIRVVIDLVLNHTSRDNPWFQDALANPDSPYRDWYLWSAEDPDYLGPWGQEVWHASPAGDEEYYGIFWEGMPDLNYRNPEVTAEAEKISAFWLTEMDVDGFRLDAIQYLIEEGEIQEDTAATHDWLRRYRAFLDATAPDALTIGELFGSSVSTLTPYYPDQLHTYFNFEIGQQLIAAANFGAGNVFVAAVENAVDGLPSQRWAPFLTNHDQPRVMTVLGGNVDEAKIAATALLTLPGLPFVYYGEEIGMSGNKPDERIRTPMQWTADPGSGFSTAEPWQPFQEDAATLNVATQTADPDSLLNHYRRLVHLHAAHPALSHGGFVALDTGQRSVVAFVRQSEDEVILVVLNFGREPADGAAITGTLDDLSPGAYDLLPLLGDQPGAPLTVAADGAITSFVPLPTLAPLTGYVFQLGPA